MDTFKVVAIGMILAATCIELPIIISNARDKNLAKDARSNFLLGVVYFLTDLLVKTIVFGVFSFCYHHSVFKPGLSGWLWIVGFVACDFVNYIYHYLGHTTRILWAAHITHHSSEYYNMSHGYRINFFQSCYRFLFWTPLCFLGIPPVVVFFHYTFSSLQNFLVHTEKVGKLGVMDWLFNTPSNHRVHHGTNPEYLNKNMGAVFMIFDHLFGTYAKEEKPAVYGITRPIHTNDPYKLIMHEYIRVGKELPKTRGILNKLRYLFSRPD